jgi:hypothetical protein
MLSRSSGGVMMPMQRRYIGLHGGIVYSKKKRGGLGLRDPHCFNLAMLAKQVWRLLCEPESLCARVLRAKYYPDGKLLKAKMKSGDSFTWQLYTSWD